MIVPGISETEQLNLLKSKVLIVGLGGLGCPVATQLATAGVGTLMLSDYDSVSLSNIHRQHLYAVKDVNQEKTEIAIRKLKELVPETDYVKLPKFTDTFANLTVDSVDLVIDCSDNMETKQLINQYCVKHKKPLVVGGAVGWEGFVFSYEPQDNSPCYHCLFPSVKVKHSCESFGALGSVTTTIGSMQALLALRILLNLPRDIGVVRLFDADTLSWRTLDVSKHDNCEVCK